MKTRNSVKVALLLMIAVSSTLLTPQAAADDDGGDAEGQAQVLLGVLPCVWVSILPPDVSYVENCLPVRP